MKKFVLVIDTNKFSRKDIMQGTADAIMFPLFHGIDKYANHNLF